MKFAFYQMAPEFRGLRFVFGGVSGNCYFEISERDSISFKQISWLSETTKLILRPHLKRVCCIQFGSIHGSIDPISKCLGSSKSSSTLPPTTMVQ